MKILSPRDYFYIENIKEIGHVKIGNISFCQFDELEMYTNFKAREAIIPVFKIISGENTIFLQAGFIDHENNFFICPITIFHFSIDTINYKESTDSFETIIKAFNKGSTKVILKKVCGQDGDTLYGSFSNLVQVLNLINIYIDRGRDVNEVLFENVKRKNLYYRSRNEIVAESVNNLYIQFFETGIYVPQKDNVFYKDIEISVLPNNSYLLEILEHYLLKTYTNVSREGQKLLINLKSERWSSPSFSRRVIENTQGWETILKDNLKMDLAECFDFIEYKLARLFEV